MTMPRSSRVSPALRRYASSNRTASQPVIERVLRFLGADLPFAEDVLGDLAEERERRRVQQGSALARWWFVREALRSAPHLALNSVRHGGQRGRARVAIAIAVLALVPTAAVMTLRAESPAVRLEVDAQRNGNPRDGVIVNTTYPVRLVMHAFDAEGKPLTSPDVHYRWIAGTRAFVSPTGVITCIKAGDVMVRASLGRLVTTVRIACEPVREVHAPQMMQFVVGGGPEILPFEAVDAAGNRVYRLAGEVRVQDTTIASFSRGYIRPLAPGRTVATMRIGLGQARSAVSVYERVPSFEGLRDDQRFVIAPVHVARGDTIRWPLPEGLFWLQFHPASDTDPTPKVVVSGPIECLPGLNAKAGRVHCLAREPGASVRITYAGKSAVNIAGSLSLEQEKYP